MKAFWLCIFTITTSFAVEDNTIVGSSNKLTSNTNLDSVTLAGSHNNVVNTTDSTIIGHNSSISGCSNIISVGNEIRIDNTVNGIGIGNNLENIQNQIIMGNWNSPSSSFFIVANGSPTNKQNIFEISRGGNIMSNQMSDIMTRIQTLENELRIAKSQLEQGASLSQCSCVDLQYSFQTKQCCLNF